ncbi:MAG: DUF2127 domain-containing protein [Acidobacteria bacterium]|nr:DUF2127 domain-containing protein [Acidobacteriota bacterium]
MTRLHLRYKNQTRRERTWTIHLISLEKVVKATLLILVGYKLLALMGRDVHEWAYDFVTRHGIDTGNRFIRDALQKLVGVGDKQIFQLSAVSFVYAALLYVEGIGLWLQKRWAEYLTVIGTALFTPIEIYELYERFTWVRLIALGINIFIVWYLGTRLRDEKRETSVFVKICGITNLNDAKRAARAGADAIGFNFSTTSPRYILPERAAMISNAIRNKLVKVGVFVDSPVSEIKEIVDKVGLDAVQLHGSESDSDIQLLRRDLPENVEIIKSIKVRAGESRASFETTANAILLDTYSDTEAGGTGEVFDWTVARKAVEEGACVYLAGGLGPDNIRKAVTTVRPFAVDACSRLERFHGIKHRKKVRQFVRRAKEAI